MSQQSKKFGVPDALANLYDFANTLDARHFTHHGVPHLEGDELEGPRDLGTWLSQRGLSLTNAKISPAMFATALELRGSSAIICNAIRPGGTRTRPPCGRLIRR